MTPAPPVLVPLHGLGSRHDLPLPFPVVVAGAAAVLVVTFALLALGWRRPRYAEVTGRRMPALPPMASGVVGVVLRLAWLAVTVVAGVALVAGPDEVPNPALGFVYVWVWVGLVPASLLCGRVVRRLNPVRTLLCWRGARTPLGVRWLPRLGLWPAALALLGFVWLELGQPDHATAHVLRHWALAWLVWCVAGSLVLGTDWLGAADPFEAYSDAVARMSPWARRSGAGGRDVVLTSPLRHLVTGATPRGLAAVSCVLLASTSFDAFSSGSWFVQHMQVSSHSPVAWDACGLALVLVVVLLTYLAACWAMRVPGGRTADLMAVGLLPIAAGYALAHYATFLWITGQQTLAWFSDPLGRGDDWFATAGLQPSTWILQHPAVIAWLQVVCIVGGHLLGVVAAHDRALRLLPPRHRLTGQVPMLLVMVAYTCTGLLLLFG